MMEIFTIISSLSTAILVIITGFYAWATFKILKANEKNIKQMQDQQEAILRPYISISIITLPDNPIFYLRIKNSGLTNAQNLKLILDKNFYQYGRKNEEDNLKSFNAFREPIDSFAPGAEIIFDLAQSFVIFGKESNPELTPSIFSITAEYEYMQKKVKEKTIIYLKPYLDSAMPHDPIASQLKELQKAIEKKNDRR